MDPTTIIRTLGMQPHPEGGHYVETWRGTAGADGRAVATAIYFLLTAGERSHWHRIDAAETWLYHAGAPMRLAVHGPTGDTIETELGTDLAGGAVPQAVVPAHAWQSAESIGAWTLVSCVVAPGFEFEGFELAPPGWTPHGMDA
jgi:predicted cupin superfamily sugar epimerase